MKYLLISLFALCSTPAACQFGVAYHHSGLPFAEFNYEINDRIRPMIRLGTNDFFDDLSVEFDVTYDFINEEDYEFYGGLGVRTSYFEGLVIPIGLNVYPFDVKHFGFQMEIAPIIGDSDFLRGSLGIRYRFNN